MIGKFANALGYQLVWIACVVGAANASLVAGPMATALFAMLVLGFGGQWRADLRLIPILLLCGLLFDSAWIALGWLDYSMPWPSPQFSPSWILCIWVAFALTFNHSLAFLRGRYLFAALLGAIGGPLAYWGAAHGPGVVRFDAPVAIVLGGLCIAWAVLLPLLVRIAESRLAPAIGALP
ncbi:MAG TPA: DUF2878 domain-containing protein [Xanthomonadaceae bacterium]|nr:DUF2878 domain-containing protein [Xanthomonadaceae bacterium]